MGKKGREIVGVDVDKLIEALNKAYADEWIAYFYYKWAAEFVEGLDYQAVASELERIAAEELEHASELSERIYQLGGQPPSDWQEIYKVANCKKVELPEDERDLESVIQAVLDAEGCAIDVYTAIINDLMTIGKDPLTYHTVRHILQEEVEHEDAFENLLPKKRN